MDRRIWKNPYFFELFSLANFLVIFALVAPANPIVLTSVPVTMKIFIPQLAAFGLIGVAVRAAIAKYRGGLRAYWRKCRPSRCPVTMWKSPLSNPT